MKINLKYFPQLRELLEKIGLFREYVELEAANNIVTVNKGEATFTLQKYTTVLYVTKQNGAKYRVVDWYDLIELASLYELVSSSERTANSQEVSDLINTHFPVGGSYIDIVLNR